MVCETLELMDNPDGVSAARHLGKLWQDQYAPFVSLFSEALLSSTSIATRQSVEGFVCKRQRAFAVQTGSLSLAHIISDYWQNTQNVSYSIFSAQDIPTLWQLQQPHKVYHQHDLTGYSTPASILEVIPLLGPHMSHEIH